MTGVDLSTTDAATEPRPSRVERARRGVVRHWALVLALAYAAAIGAWQLPARGNVFIDEGYQHLEATWVDAKTDYVLRHFPGSFDERRYALDDDGGKPLSNGKPLHALLGALALKVFPGSGPTPLLILQWLFGLGVIALVYGIAYRLGGRVAAGASAGVLALSASFLAYRRSTLPEMDSAFFFALALWALVVWSARGPLTGRRALWAGVFAGLTFTANDRWYVALPIVGVVAWVLDAREAPWRRASRRAARVVAGIGVGFAIPILLFEAATVSFVWVAHDAGQNWPYETYFQMLHRRYHAVTVGYHAGPRLSQIIHSPYPRYLVSFDGQPWLLTAGAAAAFLLVRWRRAHVVPLLWTFGPLLLASASTLTAPRYMSLAIPGIALTVGFAAARLWEAGARPARAIAALALAVVAASSLYHAPEILRIHAGWDPVLAVARDGTILSPKSYPVAAHAGLHRVVLGYTDTIEWASAQRAAGARWLLLEVWTPPGTPLAQVTKTNSFTVLGPLGSLSTLFIDGAQPLYTNRFAATDFLYEGLPPGRDRLILLYDLRDLARLTAAPAP